jgi:integrase
MSFWATHFPARHPGRYVFPAERYGAAGDQFCAKAYDIDPSKPIGSIKEAWEAAKLRAGRILKGISEGGESEEKIPAPVCRFHDLRHTAVSRMLSAGVPIAKVAKIAGWSPATMVRMAARYGHFSLNELRGRLRASADWKFSRGPRYFPRYLNHLLRRGGLTNWKEWLLR